MYFSILTNARDHLLINVALKLMKDYDTKNPFWMDIGKNHWQSPYVNQLGLKWLTQKHFGNIGKSFRFYGNNRVSFRFDLWPYAPQHRFASKIIDDDIYYDANDVGHDNDENNGLNDVQSQDVIFTPYTHNKYINIASMGLLSLSICF